ncbi:MAG: hypothetical protein LBO21_03030 [Synergistaceae bacterium]|jgi:hypothetical protein|nr:hypothetical protein [Synergistaceae bacterium]
MKRKIKTFIILALIIVVLCTLLYYFRERPIGYGADTVNLEYLRVNRVTDESESDVTEWIDPIMLIEMLSKTQSRRAINTMGSYHMSDIRWEIDLIDSEQGPYHVVLGKNSFWYVSGDEWFNIAEADVLIDNIDALYEQGIDSI